MIGRLTRISAAAIAATAALWLAASAALAQAAPWMIVGLDQKLTWNTDGKPVLAPSGHDAVLIVDLAQPQAPRIVATLPIENSVVGPPVNVAISPDDRIALVADSVTVAEQGGKLQQVPAEKLFVIDLKARAPRISQVLTVGRQPSGISFDPAGNLALVAYRGGNAVGVLAVEADRVREIGRVGLGDSVSHVVFTPDGRRALAVEQTANELAFLRIDGEAVSRDPLRLPTGAFPYNVAVSPDGHIAITSDGGSGEGAIGALGVIDLRARPPRVIAHVPVDRGIEGLAVSPQCTLAVSVAVRGSNGSTRSPFYHRNGAIVILRVDGTRLTRIKEIEVGRVPEAVAFTPDGRYLYVGNFADRDFWIFRVKGTDVADTGKRFKVPGHPASVRISAR